MPRNKTSKSTSSAPRRVKLPRQRLRSLATKLHSLHRAPPSPPPAVESIKVVCISDTHGLQPPLPPGDLLLHAGDLTQWGTFTEMKAQLTWLSQQPHKYKVVIAGNHDLLLDEGFRQQHPERWKQALDAAAVGNNKKDVDVKTAKDLDWGDIIYLQNSSAALAFPSHSRTLNIFGSPLTPRHGLSSFQYNRGTDVWAGSVPANTEILLTHGPPWGHLDSVRDGVKKSGCAFLAKEVLECGLGLWYMDISTSVTAKKSRCMTMLVLHTRRSLEVGRLEGSDSHGMVYLVGAANTPEVEKSTGEDDIYQCGYCGRLRRYKVKMKRQSSVYEHPRSCFISH